MRENRWPSNMGLRARILFDLDASNAHSVRAVSISQTVLQDMQ